MSKKILITGAGTGLGEGACIGLAIAGHQVIAGVRDWAQVTKLRAKTEELSLSRNLRVEKLDILDNYDIENALKFDIEILVNNAAIGEGGPISEIPLDLVKRTFETNLFATLNLTQRFVKKFISNKVSATIFFVSSAGGLISIPGFGAYCASKHALECLAETMKIELEPFKIKVRTINPGAFDTGFNQTMAESTYRWQDDNINYNKRLHIQETFSQLLKEQLDPQIMIDEMVKIITSEQGKFRNVVPRDVENFLKWTQSNAWNDA